MLEELFAGIFMCRRMCTSSVARLKFASDVAMFNARCKQKVAINERTGKVSCCTFRFVFVGFIKSCDV